ncbi:MAG: hypothetical protein AAF614_24700 [Chloroflexota bacterium]
MRLILLMKKGMTMHPTEIELEQMRATVRTLSQLIEQLYPDVNPDILTADAAAYRYRLSGLGDRAMRAMAQSQRIVRTSGDYDQMGLCEFHAGLVYLYWGRCGSARERFAEARHHWQFSKNTATEGLTYFAEGRAQHHAHQYEWAMGKYSRVAQCIPRIHFAVAHGQPNEFAGDLANQLHIAQEDLREVMWPDEVLAVDEPPPPGQRTSTQQTPVETNFKVEDVPADGLETQENDVDQSAPQENAQASESVGANAPPPFLTFQDDTAKSGNPLPGHWRMNHNYTWYQVEKEDNDFLPDISPQTWVLVKSDLATHQYQQTDLIAVLKPDIDKGGIVLRPYQSEQPFQRIYLARSRFEGTFTYNSGRKAVELSTSLHQKMIPIRAENILGIVIGYWHVLRGEVDAS